MRLVYTFDNAGTVHHVHAYRTWRRGYLYIVGLGHTARYWDTRAAALEAARAYALAQLEIAWVRWLIADTRVQTQEVKP